jgi:hypothetical protein
MGTMGFYEQDEWSGPGGLFPNTCFKKKNRWKFIIPGVSASGVGSLPPFKSGRVSMSYKEIQAEHLNETIFFPSKPEWKPISLTLYDISKSAENPVFSWLRRAYDPKNCSTWKPCLTAQLKCAQCFLVMLDGCGEEMERWVFEHAWPQSVEFVEGDMTSGDVTYCDVTLRYDRAYIANPLSTSSLPFSPFLPSNTCDVIPSVSFVNFAPIPMIAPLAEFTRMPFLPSDDDSKIDVSIDFNIV